MRHCLIGLATDRLHYPAGLERMQASAVSSGFTGEFRLWPPGQFPAGCPAHFESPYAFKPFCFAEAGRQGMQLVLWLDSSCVVARSLDPLFEQIETQGYLLFRNKSYWVGEWISDAALERQGVSRQQALRLPEVNAGVIGLNLHSEIGREFLAQWLAAARDQVAFRGVPYPITSWPEYYEIKRNTSNRASSDPRVRGHRHDQSVAGLIAARLGMRLAPHGVQTYTPENWQIDPKTVIIIDRSVGQRHAPVAPFRHILLGHYDSWGTRLRRRFAKVTLKTG